MEELRSAPPQLNYATGSAEPRRTGLALLPLLLSIVPFIAFGLVIANEDPAAGRSATPVSGTFMLISLLMSPLNLAFATVLRLRYRSDQTSRTLCNLAILLTALETAVAMLYVVLLRSIF
jgi:hypothetical protein